MEIKLTLHEKMNYKKILSDIGGILVHFELLGQNEMIKHLLDLLDEDKGELFINELNSVNIWGGAGAVWEVGIPIKSCEIVFINKLLELIDFMELKGVLSRGAKSRKKILRWRINNM